jgi:hypothetical protein
MIRSRDFQCGGDVERGEDCAYLFGRQQWNEGLR